MISENPFLIRPAIRHATYAPTYAIIAGCQPNRGLLTQAYYCFVTQQYEKLVA
jgi:hypothetical protein